jgi:sterol desaturase/sphingolipid hydroxylase (fatty acid hydroxylase superfamily)
MFLDYAVQAWTHFAASGAFLLLASWLSFLYHPLQAGQRWREVKECVVNLAFVSLAHVVALHMADGSHVWRVYWNVDDQDPTMVSRRRSWSYIAFTLIAHIFISELCVYAAHRLLHVPWMMKRVHGSHHQFSAPTPSAFAAVHPIEGLMFFCALHVTPFLLPIYYPIVYGWNIVFTCITIVVHDHGAFELGQRVMKPIVSSPLLRAWVFSERAHGLHHAKISCNYGLVLSIFDKCFGTYQQPVDRD